MRLFCPSYLFIRTRLKVPQYEVVLSQLFINWNPFESTPIWGCSIPVIHQLEPVWTYPNMKLFYPSYLSIRTRLNIPQYEVVLSQLFINWNPFERTPIWGCSIPVIYLFEPVWKYPNMRLFYPSYLSIRTRLKVPKYEVVLSQLFIN